MSTPGAFRDDINGLRAWAVLAVVLFHFGVPGFEGGFVGVDVFFVISGYLMTRIITNGLERDRFSYLGFCLARAARILPALLALCAVLLAAGYLALTPLDYRNLATHAFSSISFISNFKYWDEAGYFDTASHEKWLLHTWSLSVEWQFYLLIPLLLMAAWARAPSRRTVLGASVLVLAVSLGFNLWATAAHPSLAFFLLPSRAWELLLGGVVFLWLEPLLRDAGLPRRGLAGVASAGLLLIATAVLLFDGQSAWPGWRALVPALGAALVVGAAAQGFWPTAHPLLHWVGTRSYSIYLWHWPVYVLSRYLGLSEQPIVVVAMGGATAVLAELSYRWVELPSQRWLGRRTMAVSLGSVAAVSVALAGAAFTIRLLDGVTGRLPSKAEWAAAQSEDTNPRKKPCHLEAGLESPSCTWGGVAGMQASLAVAGDSHALSLVTAIAASLPAGAGPVVSWTYSGCPLLLGSAPAAQLLHARGANYRCAEFQQWWKTHIDALPATVPVVIANRYASDLYGDGGNRLRYLGAGMSIDGITPASEQQAIALLSDAIVRTACAFTPHRRVLLVRPLPEMAVDVPRTVSRRIMMGLEPDVSVARSLYERRNAWAWKAQDDAVRSCGAEIVDPTALLCDTQRCHASRAGMVLYHDDDHLSETGNKLLVGLFRDALDPPAGRTSLHDGARTIPPLPGATHPR